MLRTLSLLTLLALLTPLAPEAFAQTCSTSWTNASGGDWNTAANWDNGVPGPTDDACITLDGTYTATNLSGSGIEVNSLTIGAATGTQTLNSDRAVVISSASSIEANGVWQWSNGVLSGGATLTNNGLIVLDGSPIGASRRIDGLGTLLDNSATIRWERDQLYLRDDGALTSSGTIEVNQTVGATPQILQDGTDTGSRLFTNTGTIDVQAGTFDILADSRHVSAALEVASGATLEFVTSTHAFAGTTTGTPGGDLIVSANLTAEAGAVWDVGGTGIQWRVGYLSGGETLTNSGLVVLNGAPIGAARGASDAGTVFANSGTIEWGSDEFYLRDDASLTNSGTILGISNGGQVSRLAQTGTGVKLFTNTGSIDVQVGTLELNTDARHDGATLDVDTGGTLHLNAGIHTFAGTTSGTASGDLLLSTGSVAEAGAVWNIGGRGIQWRTGFLTGGETLTNSGQLELNGAPIGAVRGVSDPGTVLANTGAVQWTSDEFYLRDDARMTNSGTLTVLRDGNVPRFALTGTGTARTFTNTGSVLVDTTTTFDVNVPFDHQTGAVIGGRGTLDIAGSTFTHSGDTAPGLSPGMLTWTGQPWAPPTGATLFIELGDVASGSDTLAVSNTATLSGALSLSIASGAAPSVGDSYTILTATSVTGTFDSIEAPPGYVVSVTYNPTNVVVTVDAVGFVVTLNGGEGWRAMSLPYADLGLGGDPPGEPVTPGLFTSIYTAGYDGADFDEDNSGGFANVFLYNETDNTYPVPATSTSVPEGRGFWFYAFQDEDAYTSGVQGVFPKELLAAGTARTTDFSFPMTFTPAATYTGANLLGNPYDEGLDWSASGWTRTNVSTTIYVYDPAFNVDPVSGFGDYRSWTVGVGGTLPGGVIPVAQGFFAYALDASPVLTAPATARTGTRPDVFGLTASGEGEDARGKTATVLPHVALTLTGEVAGHEHENTLRLVLDPEAAIGLDTHDGYALEASGDAVRLVARVLDADEALAVASVPGEAEIAVHAEALASGDPASADGVIAWEPVAMPDGWLVTLRDRTTGRSYDLTTEGSFRLNLIPDDALLIRPDAPEAAALKTANALPSSNPLRIQGDLATRFTVTFASATTATEEDAAPAALGAPQPNPVRGIVRVPYTLGASGDVHVALYDALGREVAVLASGEQGAGAHEATLDTQSLAAGVYVVRMTGADGFAATRRLTVVR